MRTEFIQPTANDVSLARAFCEKLSEVIGWEYTEISNGGEVKNAEVPIYFRISCPSSNSIYVYLVSGSAAITIDNYYVTWTANTIYRLNIIKTPYNTIAINITNNLKGANKPRYIIAQTQSGDYSGLCPQSGISENFYYLKAGGTRYNLLFYTLTENEAYYNKNYLKRQFDCYTNSFYSDLYSVIAAKKGWAFDTEANFYANGTYYRLCSGGGTNIKTGIAIADVE